MNKKWTRVGLLLIVMFSMILAGCGGAGNDQEEQGNADESQKEEEAADTEKKDQTITFGVTPWTSTIPPTHVAKLLLEDMGYTVKLQEASVGVVYTGLARGDVDVFMDAWLPEMHKNYMEKYSGKIDDTAVSYKEGELGWVVPAYVDEVNSVKDVIGNEDLFEGKIYGIEEAGGMAITSHEMIDKFGMDLEYMASSEAAMLAQARKMMDNEEPVLFLGWRPHSMFAKFDLKVLKNPEGYFETSEVHVLTHKGFDQEASEAYQFLSNWSMPVGDIEQMILKIDKGAKAEDVAREWIDNNQDKVNKMVGK